MEQSTAITPEFVAEVAAHFDEVNLTARSEHLSLNEIKMFAKAQIKKPSAKKAKKRAAKAASAPIVTRMTQEEILRRYGKAVVSTCQLENGKIIESTISAGGPTWKIDGEPATIQEVRVEVVADPKNAWTFTTADGITSTMTRPNPQAEKEAEDEAKLAWERNKERAEWNAKLAEKKAAKAYGKEIRLAELANQKLSASSPA